MRTIQQIGITPHANRQIITVHTMSYTGYQSCLVGISMIQKLGLHRFNLIPIKNEMYVVNGYNINILGAAILRFSGQDRVGNTFETRQLTFVTDTLNKLFLGKEAFTVLGMITYKFPTIGEMSPDVHIKDSKVTTQCHTLSDVAPPTSVRLRLP